MKRFINTVFGIPLVCIGVAIIAISFIVGKGTMNIFGPIALIVIITGVVGFCHNAAKQ